VTEKRNRDSIEIAREIRAAPEIVFQALTDRADLVAWWGAKTAWWMANAEADPRPGGRYRFEFANTAGQTVWIEGEYRVVDPPRRVVQTWSASMYPGLANEVEFVFEPVPAGTRLTVRHSGLAASPAALADYESGWVEVLLKLVTWLLAAAPALGIIGSSSDGE
jgi:uncharacterized protein YndB with AHSA1/START domain